MDDSEIQAGRARLMSASKRALRTGDFPRTLGIGYAIDGDVRGVRWFESHELFVTFADFLLGTAAVDAISARRGHAPEPLPALSPKAVDDFVADIEAASEVEERDTAGGNRSEYKRGRKGYGSKTRLEARDSDKPISHDHVKREPEPAQKRKPRPSNRLHRQLREQGSLAEW